MIAPARPGDRRARQARKLALDRGRDRFCKRRAVGDQDRLRGSVMLRLGQQIGGDPIRVAALVGDDEHFRRPGDHVDADRAENTALGGGDIGVSGPDDFRDGRNGLRAIGQRRDRLRAADAINFVDARELGGGKHQRRDHRHPAPARP